MMLNKIAITLFFIISATLCFSQRMMSFEEKVLPEPGLTDTTVLNFNSKQSGFSRLSIQERKFYYWVNYSRAYPKKFYDSVIMPISKVYPQLKGEYLSSLKADMEKNTALPLLSLNGKLYSMARAHAIDITSNNANPSHNSTNGETFMDRFKKNNLKKCGGENIGYGADKPIFTLALLYIDIGLPDLGHRKALMNPIFAETGIAYLYFKNGSTFVVEDFVCSQN